MIYFGTLTFGGIHLCDFLNGCADVSQLSHKFVRSERVTDEFFWVFRGVVRNAIKAMNSPVSDTQDADLLTLIKALSYNRYFMLNRSFPPTSEVTFLSSLQNCKADYFLRLFTFLKDPFDTPGMKCKVEDTEKDPSLPQ